MTEPVGTLNKPNLDTGNKGGGEWLDLLIVCGIVAAGVITAALLVQWTLERYVILAPPVVPDRVPEERDK